jgi:hypothetical protein
MSDIIDINVTPTIEQVEIVVTENLTTVNVITNSGGGGGGNSVDLTTNQTIAGVKTFVQSPIVPTATTADQAVNLGQLEASAQNAIPLSGTAVGKPITGDLEFAGNGSAFALKQIPSLGGIKIISFEDDGTILLRVDNGVVLFSLTFSSD